MQKTILAIALALLVMTSIVFSAQQFEPIKELYIFGDSLSDVGNVFRATREISPPNPPYFQGRYSNGRVWVEYLADRLHLSSSQNHNFAYGGATTGSDRHSLVPGLLTQVQSFTQTHPQTDFHALYVLWAGANDYLQGASSAVPVENVTKAVVSLVDIGAKNILVANLPDLGLPAVRTRVNAASLNALTRTHNQGLRRSLKLLTQKYPHIHLVTLDANALYREAIANPATLGFTNVTDGCLSGDRACSHPDQFLFWDGIHPTTAAHRILGERAYHVLEAGHLTISQ